MMFIAIVVPGVTFKGHRAAVIGWSIEEISVREYEPRST